MRHRIAPFVAGAAAFAFALAVAPTAFAGSYEGQVVQVQERVHTENRGELQQITVRTRDGEELRFHLGASGSCPDCVAVGDQVRLRTASKSAVDGALQVRRMAVERSNQMHTFSNRSGELVAVQSRGYAGRGGGQGAGDTDRTRDRDRDRIHAPGTGQAGGGSGARGAGNGGGGCPR